MLCSREVLPPGLRSRWPASEKLPSAMAGTQPGRCMGSAGRRKGAATLLGGADCSGDRRGSKSALPEFSRPTRGFPTQDQTRRVTPAWAARAGGGRALRAPPPRSQQASAVLTPGSWGPGRCRLPARRGPSPSLDPAPRSGEGLSLVQTQGPHRASLAGPALPNATSPFGSAPNTPNTRRGPAVGRLTGVGTRVLGPQSGLKGACPRSHASPRAASPLGLRSRSPPPNSSPASVLWLSSSAGLDAPGDPWTDQEEGCPTSGPESQSELLHGLNRLFSPSFYP